MSAWGLVLAGIGAIIIYRLAGGSVTPTPTKAQAAAQTKSFKSVAGAAVSGAPLPPKSTTPMTSPPATPASGTGFHL